MKIHDDKPEQKAPNEIVATETFEAEDERAHVAEPATDASFLEPIELCVGTAE